MPKAVGCRLHRLEQSDHLVMPGLDVSQSMSLANASYSLHVRSPFQ